MRRKQRGFTLIEVMIVVVIVAILATVAVIAYTRHVKNSRLVDAKAFVAAIQGRQEMYLQNFGYYCNASEGAWYPASTEAVAKAWSNPGPNQWGPLGARPESGSSYFQFLVGASTPPPPCSGTACAQGHDAAASTTEVKLGVCGGVIDATCTGQPWYYVIGRANLDGGADCSSSSPWVPSGETECTYLWATSARSDIVIGSEGR